MDQRALEIENQPHWVRDVTFAEGFSQARTGTGPPRHGQPT
jgi:predicted transposase YbfD/YdcC